MRKGLFAIKLDEMERMYGHLQSRLQISQSEDQHKIRREIERLKDECLENEVMLQKTAHTSRTPMAAQLAEAQLKCRRESECCLETLLEQTSGIDAQAEAATLYAEFAIDQATQVMNHALYAALIALDKQLTAEKERKGTL